MRTHLPFRRPAFVLIEVMIGVMIFALGVLALGRCIENCVTAEGIRQDAERARLALENRMAEIEAGEIATDKALSVPLDEPFQGMTILQSRQQVAAKTEKGDVINGLYQVNLEVDWTAGNEPQSKKIFFYVLRSQ
jgi:Tfp pilus assembly protein PilV